MKLLLLLISLAAYGQIPWQIVNALPGLCRVGESVFLRTAAAGAQLHVCETPNTWVQQVTGIAGGGDVSSAVSASAAGELAVMSGTTGKIITRENSLTGVLKATAGVPAVVTGTSADCVKVDGTSGACGSGGGGLTYAAARNATTSILDLPAIAINTIQVNNNLCGAVAATTFTVSSGTGTLWVAMASNCAVTVRHNIVGTCGAGCTAVSGSSGLLQGDFRLSEWVVTAGVVAATATVGPVAPTSYPLVAGTNITLSTSAGVTTIASSAGSSYPPLAAATSAYIAEDFIAGRCNTGDYIGEIGWLVNSNAGGETLVCTGSLDADHPGVATITTGATSGNDAELKALAAGITPASTFVIRGLIKLSASTTVAAAFGLCDTLTYNCSTNGVYFEKLAADTNWFAGARNATTATRTDTTVAAGTGWIAFEIKRTSASNIAFRTATTLGGLTGATAINIATNVPTAVLRPYVWVNTEAAGPRSLSVDFIDVYVTGLVR